MTFSIIQKSQLEGAERIDAEYFQTYYLELEERISMTNSLIKWGDLEGKFTTGPFGSEFNVENYDENSNHRYVRGKDVRPFFLSTGDNVYIPQKDYERLKKYSLEEGDILISVVGTLGNTAIVEKSHLPAIFSSKSTGFRAKNFNQYYLLAYLNSKYGQGLLLRAARGQVQTGLNIEDLKSLPIFIPSDSDQNHVASLVTEAKKTLEDSEIFYQQAEELLLKELGLKDFEEEDDLSYIVNFSDVADANRIDADYFRPKYERILKTIKGDIDMLINHFEIIKSKNFNYYSDGEISVIKTKQLGKQFINFEVEDNTTKETADKERLPIVRDSEVIFASMGVGSLGKTNIYYEFEDSGDYTIDSTLRIFRSKNKRVLPEVLSVYFSSWVGQELIYKYIVGTSGIISIYENYLENFPLPVLPEEKQKEIAELVKKSHKTRKKSKQLLEEAKRKVEEMIEKGGEKL